MLSIVHAARTRVWTAVLGALAAIVLGSAISPVSAVAAPVLEVSSFSHSPTTMPRNDEQLFYSVAIKNGALPNAAVGDVLTCNGTEPQKNWFPNSPNPEPTFGFEWLRNGVAIASATSQTYTVGAADAGAAIQCLVTGTNVNAAATFASLPAVVIQPVPGIEPAHPPVPNGRTEPGSRPRISGTGTARRTCSPPENWLPKAPDPDAPAYAFQWLLNAIPISTATSSEYLPTAGDSGKNLQCMITATNGGGAVVGISDNSAVGSVTQPPNLSELQTPAVEFASTTSGTVTLDLELPRGMETGVSLNGFGGEYRISAPGWTCTPYAPTSAEHSRLECTRGDALGPQAEYPAVEVGVSVGADATLAPGTLEPIVATATVSGGGSVPATATDTFSWEPPLAFGIESFSAFVAAQDGSEYTRAGGHPFSAETSFAIGSRINRQGEAAPVENIRMVNDDLPPGFLANPQAPPQRCESASAVILDLYTHPSCPRSSIVGKVDVELTGLAWFKELPLYLVRPERGTPAQMAFFVAGSGPSGEALYVLTPRLRPGDGYAISAAASPAPTMPALESVSVTLCGFGTNVAGSPQNFVKATSCKGQNEPGANAVPFITNPTQCAAVPPETRLSVDSWQHPGPLNLEGGPDLSDPRWHSAAYQLNQPVSDCGLVPFSPSEVELRPTSHRADSPTGLDVSIKIPSEGLEASGGIAQSALKKAVVTLPQGMAVNPSAADGLGACALSQIKLGTNEPVQCPDSSRIGSAEVVTPLLAEHLNGNVYLAKQGDNPFRSLLALYLVVESKERGILVKIPGKVEADPQSGRLVATFDDNPQVPFSSLKLHFNEGNRAPLLNPPACGSYGIVSQLSPWSAPNQPRSTTSTFQVTEGPNGGACPGGGLAPKLEAGLQNPVAGTTSPFTLRLSREDGTQRFRALDVAMPPGLTAYLKGVPYCPDSALASVSEAEGTGQAQIDHPSCPAASQIGTVSVGAGGGSNPFYVNTGRAYLAGPYKGAPLSIAIVTPAVAGPFDLGSVVVRSAVHVDPETARITVDSDPIPTILHGIPLDVRDIRVNVDRPQFTLAPTSCEAKAVGATVTGEGGAVASPSNRFQVGDCAALGFAPKLKLQLKGATKRIGHPALKAVVTYPKGGSYANIARAQVNLPHGEFLDQGNLNKTCTRPVLLAGNCPKSSVYGKAKAWTPLLDKPLQGPVYLVGGYGYKLPALVADLNGQIRVTLVGKVDSGKNKGIRNTFEVVPDAPVSRFELRMKGGKKYGLLENSENLCKAKKARRRAIVRFTGQNGKVDAYKPVVQNECGKHRKKRRAGHGGKGKKG
jgi:hypothetical protein